jgi:hypothetical protein
MDASFFCDFRDFHLLVPTSRARVACNPQDRRSLGKYAAISGHFPLPVLLQVTSASSIGTIMREPRARLLSQYTFWRTPGVEDYLAPYRTWEHALRPLDEFLAERCVASATDNVASRMLLNGDSRISDLDFIPPRHVEQIAAAAIERLDELGFVGIMELGDSARHGVERLFDVKLEPMRVNVTGEDNNVIPAAPHERLVSAQTLDLLEQRTAADRIVYDHALDRAGVRGHQRERLAESSFAQQLVRLGDLLGTRAAMVSDLYEQLWAPRVLAATASIRTAVPPGQAVIVVDQQEWGVGEAIDGRRVIPFIERDGEYWGPPTDSATAVRELERLRQSGIGFIAFGWPAFWWLEYYPGLHERLQSTANCLSRSDEVIVFDLRDHPSTAEHKR